MVPLMPPSDFPLFPEPSVPIELVRNSRLACDERVEAGAIASSCSWVGF